MDNKMKYLIHAHKDLPIAIHPPKAFKQWFIETCMLPYFLLGIKWFQIYAIQISKDNLWITTYDYQIYFTMKVHTYQNLRLYIDSRLQWVAKKTKRIITKWL